MEFYSTIQIWCYLYIIFFLKFLSWLYKQTIHDVETISILENKLKCIYYVSSFCLYICMHFITYSGILHTVTVAHSVFRVPIY